MIKSWDQQSKFLPYEFLCGITEHAFSCGVNGFNNSAASMESDDSVHNSIKDCLYQCCTITQTLLSFIFLSDITEHQYSADNFSIAVVNRRATIGDRAFNTIASNQYGVICKALNCALRQSLFYRNCSELACFLVDDMKNLVDRQSNGLSLFPTGELFCYRIQNSYTTFSIGCNNCITD